MAKQRIIAITGASGGLAQELSSSSPSVTALSSWDETRTNLRNAIAM